MRIGFDAKRLFHNRSGLGQYSRYIVSHLSEMYPEVEWILFAKSSSHLFEPRRNTKFWQLPFPSAYRRSVDMRSQWMKSGVQLYHGLSNELPRKSTPHIKTVVTIHDLLFQDFPEDYPWMDRQVYESKVRSALNISNHIVAISQATKNDIIERYGISSERISVQYQSCLPVFLEKRIPGFIESIKERYGLPRPYVICVSSFSHRKNQLNLVRAFGLSGASKTHDLVLVGGESSYKDLVRDEVNKLRLKDQVKFPVVDQALVLSAMYQGADLVVYPSKREGFGIPVVEGMASHVPVITSANTSCEEAGGDAVLTFSSDDAESMASVIAQVIDNDALQKEMVKKGVARLKEIAPEKEIVKLFELYRSLID